MLMVNRYVFVAMVFSIDHVESKIGRKARYIVPLDSWQFLGGC